VSKLFPQIFVMNQREYFIEYARAFGDNPTKYLQKLDQLEAQAKEEQQMAAEQAPEGQKQAAEAPQSQGAAGGAPAPANVATAPIKQ
jgi:hypothetical protein